jgi:hypothetical protein
MPLLSHHNFPKKKHIKSKHYAVFYTLMKSVICDEYLRLTWYQENHVEILELKLMN